MAVCPPTMKRVKRLAPAVKCTPEEWVKLFPNDLTQTMAFFSVSSVTIGIDHIRVDTIKDHLKSKKHSKERI